MNIKQALAVASMAAALALAGCAAPVVAHYPTEPAETQPAPAPAPPPAPAPEPEPELPTADALSQSVCDVLDEMGPAIGVPAMYNIAAGHGIVGADADTLLALAILTTCPEYEQQIIDLAAGAN